MVWNEWVTLEHEARRGACTHTHGRVRPRIFRTVHASKTAWSRGGVEQTNGVCQEFSGRGKAQTGMHWKRRCFSTLVAAGERGERGGGMRHVICKRASWIYTGS